MHQFDGEWIGDAIVECDRDCNKIMDLQALDTEEKTMFSINELLLLGKFTCNPIYFGENYLRSDVSVEVKIIEARTLDAADAKVLSNGTATLGSKVTVMLPHPILIRPGFFYTICIN